LCIIGNADLKQREYEAEGILGLYSRPPMRIHFEETVSPEDIAFIFENIENNLRIGHSKLHQRHRIKL